MSCHGVMACIAIIQPMSLAGPMGALRVPPRKSKSDPDLKTSWNGCFWTPTCEMRHGPFRAHPVDNGDAYATRDELPPEVKVYAELLFESASRPWSSTYVSKSIRGKVTSCRLPNVIFAASKIEFPIRMALL